MKNKTQRYCQTLFDREYEMINKIVKFKVGTPFNKELSWEKAKNYAESSGMRLPTRIESLIILKNQDKLGLDIPPYWWTCEGDDSLSAWDVRNCGHVYSHNKCFRFGVIPVSDIEGVEVNEIISFKIGEPPIEKMCWDEAKNYAKSQSMRLPTKIESLIMAENRDELGIKLPSYWWTSEEKFDTVAWYVENSGYIGGYPTYFGRWTVPVADVESVNSKEN